MFPSATGDSGDLCGFVHATDHQAGHGRVSCMYIIAHVFSADNAVYIHSTMTVKACSCLAAGALVYIPSVVMTSYLFIATVR